MDTLTLMVIVGCFALESVQLSLADCAACDDRYTVWLANKTFSNKEFYNSFNNSGHMDGVAAGDALCSIADSIANNCYQDCKPANGSWPPASARYANTLQQFIYTKCIAHECRLANVEMCSFGPYYSAVCGVPNEPRSLCIEDIRSRSGCDITSMCHKAHRRAFADGINKRLNCFLKYPQQMRQDIVTSDDEKRKLQNCKDILAAGCLASWHNVTTNLDMNQFVELTPEGHQRLCQTQNATLQCIADSISPTGTILYEGFNYTNPCIEKALLHPEKIMEFHAEITSIYSKICPTEAMEMRCSSGNSTNPEANTTMTGNHIMMPMEQLDTTASTIKEADNSTSDHSAHELMDHNENAADNTTKMGDEETTTLSSVNAKESAKGGPAARGKATAGVESLTISWALFILTLSTMLLKQ